MDAYNSTLEELEQMVTALGAEPYRARQLFTWVHRKGVSSWEEMTDLPKPLRSALAERLELSLPRVLKRAGNENGLTIKYLLQLADGNQIEAVRMSYPERERARERHTVCLSSQAGCAMGCLLCATGQAGFSRNLTAGEMVGQALVMNKELQQAGRRITHLVFMGMGEPLANYDALLQAIHLLSHSLGLHLSLRRMAISTCGFVPGILRLATAGLPVRLAVSLHAADDVLRDRLVPINRHYPLAQLISSLRYYQQVTARRLTIAYTLVKGLNDSEQQARRLLSLVDGLKVHFNLIPVNEVAETRWAPPPPAKVQAFRQVLEVSGQPVTVRQTRGAGIVAACGQLRSARGDDRRQAARVVGPEVAGGGKSGR